MNLIGFASKTAVTVARSDITKSLVQLIVGGIASSVTGHAYQKFVMKQPVVVGEN